jgi:hypothetical protein
MALVGQPIGHESRPGKTNSTQKQNAGPINGINELARDSIGN